MLHVYAAQAESWLENPELIAEAAAQIERKMFTAAPPAKTKDRGPPEEEAKREAEAKQDSRGMAKVFSKAFAAAMGQPPPSRVSARVGDEGGGGGGGDAAVANAFSTEKESTAKPAGLNPDAAPFTLNPNAGSWTPQ